MNPSGARIEDVSGTLVPEELLFNAVTLAFLLLDVTGLGRLGSSLINSLQTDERITFFRVPPYFRVVLDACLYDVLNWRRDDSTQHTPKAKIATSIDKIASMVIAINGDSSSSCILVQSSAVEPEN